MARAGDEVRSVNLLFVELGDEVYFSHDKIIDGTCDKAVVGYHKSNMLTTEARLVYSSMISMSHISARGRKITKETTNVQN